MPSWDIWFIVGSSSSAPHTPPTTPGLITSVHFYPRRWEELPLFEQNKFLREHAPPILQLMRHRWPMAQADFLGQTPPSMWG